MRKFMVLLVVAVVGVGVPTATAGATTTRAVSITSCGQVITTDAVLHTNLVCAGDGLIIEASGVTVRLDGHSITSTDGSGVGIQVGLPTTCTSESCTPAICVDDVSVRGGTISGFLDGLAGSTPCGLSSPTPPPRSSISAMRLLDNEWGLYLTQEFPLSVNRTSIVGPNGIGPNCSSPCGSGTVDLSRSTIKVTSPSGTSVADIFGNITHIDSSRLDGGVVDVTDADVIISHGRLTGVTVDCGDGGFGISNSQLSDSTISDTNVCGVGLTGNRIVGPGSGVFVYMDMGPYSAVVSNNHFSGWGTAVQIWTIYGNLTMTGNTFRHNGTGVATCTGEGCYVTGTISDNQFLDNRGTGLLITDGDVHIGSNLAVGNGGLGIDVAGSPLTVIDDGGNVARHNQPPQCIGVVCSS